MRAVSALVGVLLLVASTASAQTSTNRAWQQRLSLEIPLPVPAVELESVNPFALPVDNPPNLLTSAPPAQVGGMVQSSGGRITFAIWSANPSKTRRSIDRYCGSSSAGWRFWGSWCFCMCWREDR